MAERGYIISRYYHTLRYLKFRQTIGRSYAGFKRRFKLFHAAEIPEKLKGRLRHKTSFLNYEPWNCRKALLEKNFKFLNDTKMFDGEIDWRSEDMPLLWRFNLHYFNYLHLLDKSEKEKLCLGWISNNPEGRSTAWHPYPLSLRIVNWCKEDFDNAEILKSLFKQAAWLYRNLETYHPGNHLLENARALIFAGLFFQGQGESIRWLRRGIRILENELPVQVLSDGGYFERSTMYHALMLENILDVMNIMCYEIISVPGLKETACKMGDFLASITHPDKKISLFNDSTAEIAPPAEYILEYLKKLTGYSASLRSHFPEAGYFIHRGKNVCLIIDGGALGPDYLPAHSHADIFSYELSVFNERIITDSGVYEYADGPMRKYARSTRAHNTLSVDGMDQAECWGSFRLAKRFPPKDVKFSIESCKSIFQGRFEGYASLIGDGIIHERQIETDEEKRIIIVKDTVRGEGKHKAESFIHLEPSSTLIMEGGVFIIKTGERIIKIIPLSGRTSVEKGWYCPQFGRKIQSQVLVFSQEALPAEIGYRIEF